MNIVSHWLLQSLDLFRLMAPYLLLGFLLAGVLHVLVPREWVARHLGGRGLSAAVKAALIGTPLPLCSCGVIPFADMLKRQGASRSAITSFLISTPQTGADSILASYGILGLPITLWKVLTALVSGVVGGVVSGWVDRDGRHAAAHDAATTGIAGPVAQVASTTAQVAGCCGGTACSTLPDAHRQRGLRVRGRNALSYGLGTLVREIALWLVIGTLIGGAISAFVPDDFLARHFPNPYLQMIAVMAVAVPLYVCATGSVPVAAALIMKGMPMGAAIVFLIAGPGTNVATLTVFTKVLGRRTVAVYLGTIIVMSFIAGALFQAFFPHVQLPMAAHAMHGHEHHLGGGVLTDVAWWQIAASALLGLLVVRALVLKTREHLASRARAARNGAAHSAPAMALAGGRGEAMAMETIRLKVEGMTCGHCRSSVEKALRGVAGVKEVQVLLEEHQATIRGERLEVKALIAAVEASGFEASPATT